jgi:light-regulated signal transduction histidine kinase (bacteriophytochrome)
MRLLVDNLISYAKADRVQQPYSKINLNTLLKDICEENLNELIQSHQAIIHYKDLPTIKTDMIKLFQLFSNLISNAILYNDSPIPEVTITAKKNGNFMNILIIDNGIGIDMQYKDKIFELFERLNDKRRYHGSGLGLSICKRIVEMLGGKLWLDKSNNEGSVFIFSLPIKKVSKH